MDDQGKCGFSGSCTCLPSGLTMLSLLCCSQSQYSTKIGVGYTAKVILQNLVLLERRSGIYSTFSLINFVHDFPRLIMKVASADDQMFGCNIVWSILLKIVMEGSSGSHLKCDFLFVF